MCMETHSFLLILGCKCCFIESRRLSLLCQYLWLVNDQPFDLMAVPGVHPNLSPVFPPQKKKKRKSKYNCMFMCKVNAFWILCF